MKRPWRAQELREYWLFLAKERFLLARKTLSSQLGFAVLRRSFQLESRFPRSFRQGRGVGRVQRSEGGSTTGRRGQYPQGSR
jgi:hypothetical protein